MRPWLRPWPGVAHAGPLWVRSFGAESRGRGALPGRVAGSYGCPGPSGYRQGHATRKWRGPSPGWGAPQHRDVRGFGYRRRGGQVGRGCRGDGCRRGRTLLPLHTQLGEYGARPPLTQSTSVYLRTDTPTHITTNHTNKQTNKQTNTQTNKQTNTQTNKQTNTHKQTNTQTNKQTHKQTNKQANKQIKTKQTHKQTNSI